MNFSLHFLGCRVNQAEIENIGEELIKNGFKKAKENEIRDLIIINTCAVTQKAEKETRKEIRRLRREFPKTFLVVLGCGIDAAQKFKTFIPQADLVISNTHKDKTVELILKRFKTIKQEIREDLVKNKFANSGRALIKIQDGCKKFCSYCIVPFLRTRLESKKPKEVIEEIKELEKEGIKEIILTGIDISVYGKDLKQEIDLIKLIEKILKETEIPKITLSSIDPQSLNKDFISLLKNRRVSRFLHLSLQSGSETTLERMERKTNLKDLIKKLNYIKKKLPEFTLRVDIIVGFPEETDEEFNETLQFIEAAKISFVHVFPYSRRPGTLASLKIENGQWKDIPLKVKRERVKKILELTKNIRMKEGVNLINKTIECLVINEVFQNTWEVLANNSWKILIKKPLNKVQSGQLIKVKIISLKDDYLLGELS